MKLSPLISVEVYIHCSILSVKTASDYFTSY